MQVFGEGGSEEQVKDQYTELLKLKTVGDHLRFLDASPKTCMNRNCEPIESSNACFCEEERNDYFFVSMAYHLSEQASHLVSRGSLRP
jgi:hypothetical protein